MMNFVTKTLLKPFLIFILIFSFVRLSNAQKSINDVPVFGAQVFIENGETPKDIEPCFMILKLNGMKTTCIRMGYT